MMFREFSSCTWRRPSRSKHCTIAIYCIHFFCYMKSLTSLLICVFNANDYYTIQYNWYSWGALYLLIVHDGFFHIIQFLYDSKLSRILALTATNKVLDGSNYGKTEGTNVWVSDCVPPCVFCRTFYFVTPPCFIPPPPSHHLHSLPHTHTHKQTNTHTHTTAGMGLAEWTEPEGVVRASTRDNSVCNKFDLLILYSFLSGCMTTLQESSDTRRTRPCVWMLGPPLYPAVTLLHRQCLSG